MLVFVFVVVFGQSFLGSAYVVLRNGYYSPWQYQPWRSVPIVHQPPHQPSYQLVYYYAKQQENLELKTLKERQITNFNLIKCLIEEETKSVCQSMLDGAKPLFQEPKKPENTVATKVITTEKEHQPPKSTISQPYPPTTEKNTVSALETRSQGDTAVPLSLASDSKVTQSVTSETISKDNAESEDNVNVSLPTTGGTSEKI
ncbi:hypothetical protein FQR65_LT07488 [Abscondita terminalis]|nr:hypothetical protein FQR65_LT07488 [Abscondita terminalis]